MVYNQSVIIEVKDLEKMFLVGKQEVLVLKKITTKIDSGEFVIIFGPSGCGKSTFLHTILGLEPPSKGNIYFEGKNLYQMTDDQRSEERKHKVGTIYQQPLWIKALNVIENVGFPLRLLGMEDIEINQKASKALIAVKMEQWQTYLPMELSAGQQQKISLARALIIDPVMIVADEPTGNLDTTSGQELINTFLELNKQGRTIVMITHDLEYLKFATRILHMIDGNIVAEYDKRKNGKRFEAAGKKYISGISETDIRDPSFLNKVKL